MLRKIAGLIARSKTKRRLEYYLVELIQRVLSAYLPVGGGSKSNLHNDSQSKDSEVDVIANFKLGLVILMKAIP